MSTIEKAMAQLQGKQDPEKDKSSSPEESQNTTSVPDGEENLNQENASESVAQAKTSTGGATESPHGTSEDVITAPTRPAPSDSDTTAASAPAAKETSNKQTSEQHQSNSAIEERAQSAPSDTADDNNSGSQYVEIDLHYLESRGYVHKQSSNKVIKEQFRAIKRKLLNNAFGALSKTLHHPNLIIVSSCNPHEGKTFSSINLALNMALEQDKTVLLVDSDVVRPSVARELGVKPEVGLTDYLSGKIKDVSEIIFSTNIDNFKFIPAGKPHDLSTELLASEKMNRLTNELATRYSDRVVIFDAPPLLGVNETHVMANLVGQAVVVVEEEKTKLADVEKAVSQLDENLAIGFLLNKSKRAWQDYYGYNYYAES
ncbi:protein-tyrosine kinase [Oleiphilus messinensis]|uniref:non-specific protein-tyrosine kinase n=1 Tax=Oleiphilus messinensis TaxID=141451 RepID=A0A1Y0I7I6_9GAMM|nr:XrtA-associated tyrosine autokinase [Oleiphilus messinensis]ARU56159.1 protein-tyrosine kinase [Oleiphilus messinensis]